MTDDAISREAAVAALEAYLTPYRGTIDTGSIHRNGVIGDVIAAIRALPSAPAPQPTIPPEVKLALRVLLNHVEPGWDNCKTAVQLWLDAAPCGCATCVLPNICPDGDECQDAQFHAPAPLPWTEGALISALTRTEMNRYQAERVARIVLAGPGGKP